MQRAIDDRFIDAFEGGAELATCGRPEEVRDITGNGRRVAFRMLHVWEFKDGLMSRENVGWMAAPSCSR